ncbi:MAG TPA: bifunctional (p)ppGpp synthetase/guanosine-3',5'-bis(diphosphate) 3'-pyrophosphohydrolase, partial [Acholeplasmataceae bacterium]|nr:bifunctional (p)ppGpp synthetase/guanosine-3',5'-bis(diphosphate) 3'-pyrophosphohydrolase [Acholeplasmataceae bacterium]
VMNRLMPEVSKEQLIQRQIERTQRQLTATSDTGVIIEGLTTPQIKLANCCTPVPGDSIVGYVTKGSGIVVHAVHCTNLKQYDKNRLLTAYWGTNMNRKYGTWLKIKGTTRNNLLTEIIQTANSSGVSIAEVSAVTSHELESVIKLKVTVKERRELEVLIVNLQKVPQVYYVEREII